VACTGGNQAALAGKTAFCSVPTGVLRAGDGPYAVSATYSGDQNYQSSTGSTTQTVSPLATHLRLTSSENPANPGDQVTLSATLTPAENTGGQIAGVVVFSFGGTNPPSCQGGNTVAITNNVAMCSGSFASTGAKANYPVTANFAGSADYGSSNNSVTEKVLAQ
jgi:hypothetical protein